MTEILSPLTGSFWPALIAIGTAVLSALGLYAKGRYDKKTQLEREKLQQEIEAHDRINNADTGTGATDAERIAELQRLSKQWYGD